MVGVFKEKAKLQDGPKWDANGCLLEVSIASTYEATFVKYLLNDW